VTAWLRGQIVFFNTPLRAVIAELNRYRRGYIVIANGKLETLKISGVFATDDPNAALAAIAATLPVRIIRLTDYLVLLR
jgi:transmembrane sensor